ncbi:MAG: hypothetical protein HC919_14710, partial [Oscillatoriales cyanobacterium SM2_2_1]|nr:hypothetical protein [Oscillatoriales cyanobacterium SM2_2_1]
CRRSLMRLIRGLAERRPNVILVATTFGGDPDAAYRMARFLQQQYDRFTLCVFGFCKSAGTLLAIGADEIVMSNFGELGPLDIQVSKEDDFRSRSGLDINEALDEIAAQAILLFEDYLLSILSRRQPTFTTRTAADLASHMAVELLAPISSQIDPLKLGEMNRAMQIASEYGLRLNPTLEKTIGQLVEGYPSHSFVIDFNEARELFRTVREPTPDEIQLEELLFSMVRRPIEFVDNLLSLLVEKEQQEYGHPHEHRSSAEGTAPQAVETDD